MAADGDIPPMQSPTYGRIMNLLQSAHASIRVVKSSMNLQAPFVYTHMLATLVIINNILNALAFGLLAGVTVGTIVQAKGIPESPIPGAPEPPKDPFKDKATEGQMSRDIQNLVIGFMFMVVGPCLYQALLQVAILIAQPFNNEDAMIPVMRLLNDLERDLRDGWRFANNTPAWSAPSFKESMAKAKAKAAAKPAAAPPAPLPAPGP
eukprot:gnl/TRDRNA2_/TRDRNA2_166732_c1_seq2.p2 gnl/TRDRNA2_/TRDRNA2_166732_c1~~gnl/TRDRNA2_/TRDRNA2_166732_c1_seq2.p2  ORF type:complete len:239 (-),score=48.88 gnl/TRDRNA2_/TRDRNA2_166732_c1_seq2:98-718(-)